MSKSTDRKYIKTKFEGVYYRTSTKRDPRTGEFDRVYCFWYADKAGKGHWKTVGRHSKGIRPQTARTARAKFLTDLDGGMDPSQHAVTVGQVVDEYVKWAETARRSIIGNLSQYKRHLAPRLHNVPLANVTAVMLNNIKGELIKTPIANPDKKRPRSHS
jgi:hypothetical protein